MRADLARVRATTRPALDPATRTSFEVVESAYSTALDGFALPYGDVAVGGWRNAPYVVIQNVGGYLDFPRFLDSDHPVREAADAEAYLARLEAAPGRARRRARADPRGARAWAWSRPTSCSPRRSRRWNPRSPTRKRAARWSNSLTRRTAEANIAGDWAARARPIVTGPIAAALERQLAELKRQATLADGDPGMWAQPRGDEWYAWALRASTTTRLTPDEIHEMGLTQLDEIHGADGPDPARASAIPRARSASG